MMESDLDRIREALRKKGLYGQQLYTKTLPVLLDVIAEKSLDCNGSPFLDIYEAERKLKDLNTQIERKTEALEELKQTEANVRKAILLAREQDYEYIESFYKSLESCETPEAKDNMRIAQMYVNSVEINTKYDNTAFIIGLASILSGGKMEPIEELKKINKKISSSFPYVIKQSRSCLGEY